MKKANTMKNVIKLLTAINEHEMIMRDTYLNDGDEVNARIHISKALAIDEAIFLLTDEQYFKDIKEIFIKE